MLHHATKNNVHKECLKIERIMCFMYIVQNSYNRNLNFELRLKITILGNSLKLVSSGMHFLDVFF